MSNNLSCVKCGNNIVSGYSYCASCNTHQIYWKQFLSRFVNIFSAVSVVIGAIILTASFLPDARKTFYFLDSIELIEVKTKGFQKGGQIAIANSGDGDIFLTDLIFSLADVSLPLETRVSVHMLIKKSEAESITVPTVEISGNEFSDTVGLNEFKQWIANREPSKQKEDAAGCFYIKVFDEQRGFYVHELLRGHTVKVEASIYSVGSKESKIVELNRQIQGILFRRVSENCGTEIGK
jgi:hypothetical protein